MSTIRLSKVLKELNIGKDRAIQTLTAKGFVVEDNPNTKISDEQYHILLGEFEQDRSRKEKSEQVSLSVREEKETLRAEKEAIKHKEEVAAPAPAVEPEKPVAAPEPEPVVPVEEPTLSLKK